MCGIAGALLKNDSITLSPDLLQNILKHRGPDSQNFYNHNKAYFWHFRLSIIDISDAGAQPFHFKDLILTYNGELYNYKELKKELQDKGYSFETLSDTEVLIKAFHCWREKAANKFIGMFAFAVYDKSSKELFLFRDRVGVKPLYYANTSRGFFFGSEIKAFYHFPIQRTINLQAAADFFRYGYSTGEKTIWNEIKKVSPGNYIHITDIVEVKQYWSLNESIDSATSYSEPQWLDKLEETMISAFNYRMVSDVPVGVFLSGGIDSSLVTAILQKHHGNINTFTIGFNESKFNEAVNAKKIASYLGTNHIEQYLEIESAKHLLNNFYDIYDEPFADTSGIPTTIVSILARENRVKVVLSADGGDELFGGYSHYIEYVNLYNGINAFPSSVRVLISNLIKKAAPKFLRGKLIFGNLEHRIYAFEEIMRVRNIIDFFKSMVANQTEQEIANLLQGYQVKKPSLIKSNNEDLLNQLMRHDFNNYLPDDLLTKVDRATMYNSIEGREPFLDHRLIELAYSMPSSFKFKDGTGKYPLRKILSKYIPIEFFDRPKQGFSIPIFQWFTKEFDVLFDKYLSPEMINKCDILNYEEVAKEKRKYQYNKVRGHQHNIEKMWRLLSFMMWWDKWGES